MTPSANELVTDVLNGVAPRTVAAIGSDAQTLINPWLESNRETSVMQFSDSREFLAHPSFSVEWSLICGCLEDLTDAEGSEFLGRLRNLSSPKFCLLIEDRHPIWNARSLAGFAIEQLAQEPFALPSGQLVRAFGYDLTTYKRTPDWLNADFWANPGRWNKDFW